MSFLSPTVIFDRLSACVCGVDGDFDGDGRQLFFELESYAVIKIFWFVGMYVGVLGVCWGVFVGYV